MLEAKLKELIDSEMFDELVSIAENSDINELAAATKKLSNEYVIAFFKNIPPKIASAIFFELSNETQLFVIENLGFDSFKLLSEEILENEPEKKLSPSVFNTLLLTLKSETRHEKLLEIIENLESKNFTKLKPLISEMEPVDVAEIFNDVDDEKDALLFRLLPKNLASDVFANLNSKSQEALIKSFTDAELKSIVNDLFIDDTVDLIEEMPSNVVIRILKLSSSETRESINKLLGFPKDSAGSIMTTEFVSLREKMTVEEALTKIRKQALDKETIYTLYVTDDSKKLLGIVTAKDLILSNPKEKIGKLMQDNFVFATTKTDREEVSNLLSKYDLLAIPIVDNENRINGIVTIDDAIDVMKEETSEDISKMAAIVPTSKPYLQTSVFAIFKSRLPWLLILLISATFTGLIINTYEATLNSISPLLFACIPMLMDSGGNAGSQASVTIIRSLALGEVEFKNIFKIIWKEIRVAVLLALVLSIFCFAKLQLIDNLIFGYNYSIKISLVVASALFLTICLAKMVGSCLPLFAKKLKLDPAVVASPFITTIVDAISLMLFCQISIILL